MSFHHIIMYTWVDINAICFHLDLTFPGEDGQRQVRHLDGAQDRRQDLRAARRHHRGEAEDDHDRLRLPHGQGLHPEPRLQASLVASSFLVAGAKGTLFWRTVFVQVRRVFFRLLRRSRWLPFCANSTLLAV